MSSIFIVLWMVFFHIVDDYYLQGWLASAKQKVWWKRNAPQNLYKYDYTVALVMHSFSWSYMILIPIAYINKFDIGASFILAFAVNAIVHGIVDHLKANALKINLIVDQTIHIFQIIFTAMFFV